MIFTFFSSDFSVIEDVTLLSKLAKLMKVDLRDFIVNNKDQIMESLLENEDFEQVLQFDKK